MLCYRTKSREAHKMIFNGDLLGIVLQKWYNF